MAPKRSKGGASAASSKRTRTSPAPEEDDDIAMAPDTEDPVSPGTTASHSPDGRHDDEADDSDAADDDDEEFDGATAEAEIRAQMEADSADDDGDDEEEAEEDVATYRRKAINKKGKSAEAGVIHEIYCENFMCHKKLEMKFCKNVNFINGQNGSGKSAILAALQICLGARAKTTHRGNNMGDLVRHGFDGQAVVRVAITNAGSDGWQHESFGDLIYVERKFGRSGTGSANSFKLLDEQMRTVSTDKKMIASMLDKLNIQVENPVAVLDQENSKNFIRGSEKQKFNFFQKATDLEKVMKGIIASQENIKIAAQQAEYQHGQLKKYADVYEAAKQEYKELQGVLKLDETIAQLKVDITWTHVNEKETEQEEAREELATTSRRVAQLKAKADKAAADAEVTVDNSALEAQMEGLVNEMGEAAKESQRVRVEIQEAKRPVKAKTAQLTNEKQALRATKTDKARIQKQIDDARAEEMRDSTNEVRERIERTTRAEAERDRLTERLNALHTETAAALDTHKRRDDEAKKKKDELGGIERDIGGKERHLQQLNQQGASPLAAFGQRMPALVQKLNGIKFHGEVAGPLGQHVKLKNAEAKQWIGGLDVIVGNKLSSFAITDVRDREPLKRAMDAVGMPAREQKIMTLPFPASGARRYAPRNRAPSEYTVAEDLITVDNDVAYNALIENAHIHSATIFQSAEDAAQRGGLHLRPNSANKWQFARGISRVVFLDGAEESVSGGGYRSHKPRGQGRRMAQFGMDAGEAIAALQGELDQLGGQHRHARAETDAAERARAAAKEVCGAKGREKSDAGKQLQHVERQLEMLRDAAREEEDSKVDTSDWEAEVDELATQIGEHDRAIAAHAEELRALEEKIPELERTKAEHDRKNDRCKGEIAVCENQLSAGLDAKQKLQGKATQAATKHDAEAVKLAPLQKEADDAAAEFDAIYAQASAYTTSNRPDWDGERVKVTKSCAELQSKIKTVAARKEKELSKRNVAERDPIAAREKMERAFAILEDKMKNVKKVQIECEKLGKDRKARWTRFKKIRDFIDKQTANSFDEILNEKGQSGDVTLDHKDQTLHITWQKDNQDEASQCENVMNLSGGERSFTTLSLLLAIGEVIECPFRVMDEFDIFMDQVSRKIALKTVCEMARKMKHRQFIFITPQDLSAIVPGPDVKIVRLQNVARIGGGGQQTLTGFTA